MVMEQTVTTEQLARLYAARNQANSQLAAAHRVKPKDRDLIERMRQRASALNGAYNAALRQYKRQQKAASRDALRTELIGMYLDCQQVRTDLIGLYLDHQEAARPQCGTWGCGREA